MNYIILKDNNPYSLENCVISYIKIGWKPQGGVSVCTDNSRIYFAQAMIKEEN